MASAPDALQQKCPACGILVDVTDAEPLANIACPSCGEKMRVQRAFDNFVLVETLGVGGMGAVYKARDTRLDRFVALKVLRKELSADPIEAARLEQEARVTASVNHPNVVQVYSAGTSHGQIYLVMELVDQGSLDDLMAHDARVPEGQTLKAGIEVAKGLQAAYEKGLIHRDVKPGNILFSQGQTAKIGDFGLAGVAVQHGEAQSEIWGTPYYVAPERLNNEPEDFRSDIYSLGATLFHALAGRPPLEADTSSATELRRLKSHPPDLRAVAPDVSRETTKVINRMLAPKPANRFTSYGHAIDALQRAAGRLQTEGSTAGGPKPKTTLKLVAALGLLATLGFGAFLFLKSKPAPSPGAAVVSSPLDDSAELQERYEAARRQIIDGRYGQATAAFSQLASQAENQQPILNWIHLHAGLAALLERKEPAAREAFGKIQEGGTDAELGRFFQETSAALAAPAPLRLDAAPPIDDKSVHAFALFLYAVKNWQLSEFAEAAKFLEKFNASQPAGTAAWINDYKPVAQKYLEDARAHAEWKQLPSATSGAELRATIEKVNALARGLQMPGPLADVLHEEGVRLSANLARVAQAENAAEAEKLKLLEQEAPIWNAALAKARAEIAAYEFSQALATMNAARVTEPSLSQAQAAERKRAQWLVQWKARFIADANTGRYRSNITDLPNVTYEGVAGATPSAITLRIPGGRGTAPVKWSALTPKTLLTISSAFFPVPPPDTADRQWLAAIFSQATGQTEAAQTFGQAAAAAKAEYRENIGLLTPATP